MGFTNQQRLIAVEQSFNQGKILKPDYFRKKKRIIHDACSNKELLDPIVDKIIYPPIHDSQNNEFCYIPEGPFICAENNQTNASNSGIYMAKFPVTSAQFMSFLEDSHWPYPESDLEFLQEKSPDPNCPVCNVSWLDAKQYCRWLRNSTNEYYSLPHEDEWEYAARGIDGRPHPWGYQLPNSSLANFYEESSLNRTFEIGLFDDNQSPFGIAEMVGNIAEWCADEFDGSKDLRVLKGGSWLDRRENTNCTYRKLSHPPEKRIIDAGFRLLYLPSEMYDEYKSQIEVSKSRILARMGLRKI